jgi:predicted oxidoreductase
MWLGGSWDDEPPGKAEAGQVAAAVDAALECGINLFDHADIYCKGKSEQVFGDFLRARPGLRDEMILQSKCGIRDGRYDFSFEHITGSVEGSLARLQVDHLDILLLHRPDCLFEPDEVARAFDRLQADGKVRHFGVSNFSIGQVRLLQASLDQPLLFNQLQLGLLHPQLIEEGILVNQAPGSFSGSGLLDYCRAEDIRVQAWSPLDRGRLIQPLAGVEQRIQKAADSVANLAERHGCSREAIVLAWLLRHPAGIQPVIGTRNPQRIRACCEADGVVLTREEWYELFVAARGKNLP